jgi:hypothetical protein
LLTVTQPAFGSFMPPAAPSAKTGLLMRSPFWLGPLIQKKPLDTVAVGHALICWPLLPASASDGAPSAQAASAVATTIGSSLT